jgi:hypothetical protein
MHYIVLQKERNYHEFQILHTKNTIALKLLLFQLFSLEIFYDFFLARNCKGFGGNTETRRPMLLIQAFDYQLIL